jgi:predicted RND superfamily exporter protein
MVLWMLSIVVLLTGCGRELQQRQAFISFLQKEVIPRSSGIIVPNRSMRKKFGEYAAHYDVIVDFNNNMLENVCKPLDSLHNEYLLAMKPEASIKGRRPVIAKYRKELQQIETNLDKDLATAESQIESLKQSDDLKVVYTQVVDKHIRIPAQTLKFMIPETDEMLDKHLALIDFINSSKGKVEIKDNMIQVKDPSVLAKINEMQADISKTGQAIQTRYNEFMRQTVRKQ